MSCWLAQTGAATANDGSDIYLVWAFVLLGAAVLLVLTELFVPSGGMLGIVAAVAAIGSIIAFFQYDATWGALATIFYVVVGPILGVYVFKLWMNSPLGRGIVLGGQEMDADDSGSAGAAMSPDHVRQERQAQLQQLIGAHGVTVTPLRPVGTVRIEGQRLDAMAETGVIDAGIPIIVTEVYDNQIKVRAQ